MGRKLHLCYSSQRNRERKKSQKRIRSLSIEKQRKKLKTATSSDPQSSNDHKSTKKTEDESAGTTGITSNTTVDSDSPALKRHKNLTKGTRSLNFENVDEISETSMEREKRTQELLDKLHEIGNISKRQTTALDFSDADFELLVERCTFRNVENIRGAKLDKMSNGYSSCAMHVLYQLFERSEEFNLKTEEDIKKAVRHLCGFSQKHAQMLIQLYKKKGPGFVPGPTLYQKPGPKPKASSGPFTFEHLLVLVAFMNLHIRTNTDRSSDFLAKIMGDLPPTGEVIEDLRSFIESSICFLAQEHKDVLLGVAVNSPGPIQVDEQQVLRAIRKINKCDDIFDSFHFGDRRSIKSAGVSMTATKEAREEKRVTYISIVKANEKYPNFDPKNFSVDANYHLPALYRLPTWSVCYRMVFMDESWVSVGMRNNYVWISKHGEHHEVGNDKGIRFVLVLFVDKDGVFGWETKDYQTKRDFFVRPKNVTQAPFLKAVKDAGGELKAPASPDRRLTEEQIQYEDQTQVFFGSGGALAWQIDNNKERSNQGGTSDDGATPDLDRNESYKSNMNSETLIQIFKFVAHGAKSPTAFTIDNAPYHKKREGYSPFKPNVTIKETVQFLKEQPTDCELGKFWCENRSVKNNGEETIDSKKIKNRDSLISIMKEMVPETLSDLEYALAEIGMRKFGVPHRVIWLPPRDPELNPVEFVWGYGKYYFKSHRVAKRSKIGEIVGNMGVPECRALVVETLSSLPQKVVVDCWKHVSKTVDKFYSSTLSIKSKIDDLVTESLDEARSNGLIGTPTRSLGLTPPSTEVPSFSRVRRSPNSNGEISPVTATLTTTMTMTHAPGEETTLTTTTTMTTRAMRATTKSSNSETTSTPEMEILNTPSNRASSLRSSGKISNADKENNSLRSSNKITAAEKDSGNLKPKKLDMFSKTPSKG